MGTHEIIVLAYIIWIGLVVLAILFCAADILRNQGDEPQRTLLWFTVIAAFPVFGVFLYFFAGRSRTDSIGRRIALSADDFLTKIRPHENVFRYFSELKPYIRNGGSLSAEMLDRILPETRAIRGNHVALLRDGTAAYPQMLKEIHNAKRSILLQSFIIADDEIGRDILKALEYKASTGVEVKILYDSFGSFFSAFYRMFNRFGRGIETFRIRPFSLMNSFTRWRIQMRNHRKLLVIDGKTAFLGGINISAANVPTKRHGDSAIHDLHCRIEGPVAGELELLFLRDWMYAAKEKPADLVSSVVLPPVERKGDHSVRLVASGWGQCCEGSGKVFYTAVATARKSVWIISPYFVPDTPFLMALRMAVARGVDVRIIVPLNNNHFYVKLASRSFYGPLISDGVRIFERKGVFVHAKAMLVDSEWALVGSSNCDVRSFRLNFELDAVIRGEPFLSSLKQELENELAASNEITLEQILAKRKAVRAAENLCALLTPLL